MCVIEYIKDNISWVKDLFTIVLTITATVIAYLTYKRARATVLQPIRNEVIKKQVEILTEILTFLSSQDYSTKRLYDYVELVSMNNQILLDDIGLKKMTQKERDEVNEKLQGWVLFYNGNKTDFVYIVGNLDDFEKTLEVVDKKARQRNLLSLVDNENDSGLSVLYFTKHYYESYLKISKYSENPLLPIEIIKQLMKMKYDGRLNLLINLEETVIDHIRHYNQLTKTNNVNYETVSTLNRRSYEMFDKKRFKHEETISFLKGGIRKHLRIDEKW